MLNRLKSLLVLNWRQESSARSQLKLIVEDVLDSGPPHIYDKPLYEQKCSALFEHIYESYPERDAGVYAEAGDRLEIAQAYFIFALPTARNAGRRLVSGSATHSS